jgi:hypothetical protein
MSHTTTTTLYSLGWPYALCIPCNMLVNVIAQKGPSHEIIRVSVSSPEEDCHLSSVLILRRPPSSMMTDLPDLWQVASRSGVEAARAFALLVGSTGRFHPSAFIPRCECYYYDAQIEPDAIRVGSSCCVATSVVRL